MRDDYLELIRTRRQLLDMGWTDSRIAHAVRSGRLRTAFAGTYVTHGDSSGEPLLLLAALQTHLGADAIGVLGTAALAHGLPEPWPSDGHVHVRVPPGREHANRKGITFHAWSVDATDICTAAGLRVTTPLRTLTDIACLADRMSAVSAMDAALRSGLATTQDLIDLERTTRQRRGSRRSRSWWRLADARAESPLETRVRLCAIDGGYPPDALQLPITIDGRRYRADLAWLQPNGRWLIGEADGRDVHSAPDALYADRHRANDIVGGGADIVRFVWADTCTRGGVTRSLAPLLGPPRRRPCPNPR